jgi:hypothetical protein
VGQWVGGSVGRQVTGQWSVVSGQWPVVVGSRNGPPALRRDTPPDIT